MLLEPFADLTNLLQRDSQCLSSIIPSLLDLECHLLQSSAPKTLAATMLRDVRTRFHNILQSRSEEFNPIPAAACLLDPTLCSVLLQPDLAPLLHAAKMWIVGTCDDRPVAADPTTDSAISPALKRFKFLSSKMRADENVTASVVSNGESMLGSINRYISEVGDSEVNNSLEFWLARRACNSSLSQVAEDLLAAPASQAFVERIFSLCGILTTGRRNRMDKSLEMRAFLKLNKSN